MKYRVAELEGALLDAAVAKAEGRMPAHGWFTPDQAARCETEPPMPGQFEEFSSDWSDGGPIIEREHLVSYFTSVLYKGDVGEWECGVSAPTEECDWKRFFHGKTMLIAAMRAYVASKFGDEIELP